MTTTEQKTGRGFASMTPERRREVASLGGRAAHLLGTAHEFTTEEAVIAGRIGGTRSRRGPARSKDATTTSE